MNTKYIVAIVCFTITVIRFDEETKIVQVPLDFTSYNYNKYVYFVIANPPKDTYSLLNLLSNHLKSFASNDTIKKYSSYYHYYFEETLFTPLNSRPEQKYNYNHGRPFYIRTYSDNHGEDLLMKIIIGAKYNSKNITLYRNGKEEIEINLPWKSGMKPTYNKPKITVYNNKLGYTRREKEITFYGDGIREKEIIIYKDSLRGGNIVYKGGRREKEMIYKDGKREKEIIYDAGRRDKEIIYNDGTREREIIYADGSRRKEIILKDGRLLSPEEE